MRQIILILGIVTLALGSCKKCYDCTCDEVFESVTIDGSSRSVVSLESSYPMSDLCDSKKDIEKTVKDLEEGTTEVVESADGKTTETTTVKCTCKEA